MRTDYKKHQSDYLALLDENPALSVREYCESVELNYATARRYIKRPPEHKSLNTKFKDAKVKTKSKASCEPKLKTAKPKRGRNWNAIAKEFLVRAIKNPSLSQSDFAKEKSIPYDTLRRAFKGVRSAPEFSDLWDRYDAQLAQFKVAQKTKGTAVSVGKLNGSQNQETAHAHAQKPKRSKKTGNRSSGKSAQFAQFDDAPAYRASKLNSPVLHGGYARIINLDNEIMEMLMEIDPLSIANELVMARGQYYRMQQRLAEDLRLIEEMDENGELPLDHEGNPKDPNRLRNEVIFGYSPRLRELETSIANMVKNEQRRYENLRRIEFDEAQRAYMLPQEEANLVIELLTMRPKNNWTALETAQQIELHGAKVPAMLAHEAKMELANMEPEIDDSGVSEEELDAMFDDYSSEQESFSDAWLDHRRTLVDKALRDAEAKENGETPLDGDEINRQAKTEQEYDELAERERKKTSAFDDFDDLDEVLI